MWFAIGLLTISVSAWLMYSWRRANQWKGQSAEHEGVRYQYSISKHKGRVQLIRLGLICQTGMHFQLKRESWLDRLFKSLGLSEEQQLNRLQFDENVYVVSDDRRLSYVLKQKSQLHEVLGRFFDGRVLQGFKIKKLWCRGERLWIEAAPASSMKECSPQPLAAEVVPVLRELAGLLASTAPPGSGAHDGFIVKALLLTAISAALAINAAIQLLHTAIPKFPVVIDLAQLNATAAALGAGLLLALLGACVFLLGRTSRSHIVLIELLLVGGFGAFGSAFTSLRDYNIEFDRASPALVSATVADRYSRRCGKRSTCYYVQLSGAPLLGDKQRLKVDRSRFNDFMPGTEVMIKLHPGALGVRWIEAPMVGQAGSVER
ncbi:hypothetical protein [Pseudomarimonas arenosa]|uniref:Uncharacterized protein n=1 Tax=Pseudomarimonas arenosa TaxID=2774145 RepID=A0AAW3ZJT3_9GAMM|nr:hypothetical protein [Pseudomarimonas arenosa]MBD8525287.1 hypothetical protein [Pseudomarimonas arenosa]